MLGMGRVNKVHKRSLRTDYREQRKNQKITSKEFQKGQKIFTGFGKSQW